MKTQVITFITTASLSPSALTQAQVEMATLGSVVGWACNMNDDQSMSDLMKVVDDWNEWSDDQGISTYTAKVLNPIFNSNADFVGDSIWFGYSPNFTEMGKTLQTQATEGHKLNESVNELWPSFSQSEYATVLVRPPSDRRSSAVVTFSDCTLHEGVKPPDLVAAAKWSAYLNQSEVTAAIAYNFRGHGNPQDMAANMKVPIWRPNLESYGRDADLQVNGGRLQTSQAIFGDVISYDSARVYSATLVRSGAPE